MAGSFITRCPQCSTAFRVTDDVLKMAAGKVRCGQCFHIFEAEKAKTTTSNSSKKNAVSDDTPSQNKSPATEPQNKRAEQELETALTSAGQKHSSSNVGQPLFTAADEDIVNPNWLSTLFKEDDLELISKPPKETSVPPQVDSRTSQQTTKDDLDPWERELAEIEANLTHSAITPTIEDNDKELTKAAQQPTSNEQNQLDQVLATDIAPGSKEPDEPDYMQALHSLAQNVADKKPKLSVTQHELQESMSSIMASNNLAHLVEDDQPIKKEKTKRTGLWALGSILGIIILASQVLIHFFDQGSRSEQFRGLYRMACTYAGCTLPAFENIQTITIQHVRIQSHPKEPNALLVNAIMTNTSAYAQPMPKIALEFFDLNGSPVAARLFAPESYLHKDFLDITYMPPNTPIHLVIPIIDPGARAVTHQLKVYSAQTRSY